MFFQIDDNNKVCYHPKKTERVREKIEKKKKKHNKIDYATGWR